MVHEFNYYDLGVSQNQNQTNTISKRVCLILLMEINGNKEIWKRRRLKLGDKN